MKTRLFTALGVAGITAIMAQANITELGNDYFVNIANPLNYSSINSISGVQVDNYYNIGKYEVTKNQWDSFTTQVGAGNLHSATSIGTIYGGPYDWAGDQPAGRMNWYQAAQYCNWLTSGFIDQGAYQITGNSVTVDRTSAMALWNSVYVMPTYNEWMVAAFYDGGDFSTYVNGSDTTAPTGWNWNQALYDSGDTTGIDANIQAPDWSTSTPQNIYEPWIVGSGAMEQNGTYDMTGNLWELIEENSSAQVGGYSPLIGGSSHDDNHIVSNNALGPGWLGWTSDLEGSWTGFRVAEIGNSVIPEPASMAMIALTGFGLLVGKRWFS